MSSWRDNSSSNVLPWAPPAGARLAAASLVKRRFPALVKALQADCVIPIELSFTGLDGVLGWGARMQADLAQRYAKIRKLKYWSLEDGFLRSVGLGKAQHQALSIVIDDLGIHHDPRIQSRLEQLILEGSGPADIEQARQVRLRLIQERFTKYNCETAEPHNLPKARKAKRILLIDQVANDASIAPYGTVAFARMWADALDQDAELVIRDHPDVLAGYSAGVLRGIANTHHRDILDGRGPVDDLLPDIDEVWTVSSQFGFEALVREKTVVTYGMPFYAGWGLTDDRAADPASVAARQRRAAKTVGIDELVSSSLIQYPIYYDPVQDKRICINRALDRLSAWRREAARFKGNYVCVGFSRHKRKTARLFLGAAGSAVSFATAFPSTSRALGPQSDTVSWGRKHQASSAKPFLTVEDGFIRSSGLGSGMTKARSLCIDPVGIYYDATRPSLLEIILNETIFEDDLLRRAQRLVRSIQYFNITKYNLSDELFDARSLKAARPIAIVAEQVPDDASLRYGMPIHESSLALLAFIRKIRPDHFILFKRHPDILGRARHSDFSAADYARYADYVLERKADIVWSGIDECHSATSQLGFEALLRGVRTYCHGAPFYSGWGLTADSVKIDRRYRRLSLDQLVAGALLLYPSYRCWKSELPCDPEDVIRDIVRERDKRTNLARAFQ